MTGAGLTRRASLALLSLGAAGAVGGPTPAAAPAGLAEAARQAGRFFGVATTSDLLRADPDFARAVAAEGGLIVPEGEGKWIATQPRPGAFDFTGLDRLLAFAASHGMGFRGHCLVWHEAMPDWLPLALMEADPSHAREILTRHVTEVVGHTRGRAHSWDVVNEAVDVEAGPDHLRRSPWYRALGRDYLDVAFHAARRADPGAKLVYNDFGTDAADPRSGAKREAVIALLSDLKARGVPVDALGIQAHLMQGQAIDPAILRDYIRAASRLGLDVYVTEFDVWEGQSEGDVAAREARTAAYARVFLDAVLAEPAVRGLVTWGLSDRHSWLNTDYAPWARRRDGAPNHGLPRDPALRRTPLWHAIAEALGRPAGESAR